MTTRTEQAARTRRELVEAELRLAENTSLGALSVNLVVEEAGVAKGTFFHHLGDRGAFLLALHAARNALVVHRLSADFSALGWTDPASGAALWNSIVVETALMELAAGRRRPKTRAALAQFLPER